MHIYIPAYPLCLISTAAATGAHAILVLTEWDEFVHYDYQVHFTLRLNDLDLRMSNWKKGREKNNNKERKEKGAC